MMSSSFMKRLKIRLRTSVLGKVLIGKDSRRDSLAWLQTEIFCIRFFRICVCIYRDKLPFESGVRQGGSPKNKRRRKVYL